MKHNRRIKIFVIASCVVLATATVADRKMYIQSPSARLLDSPKMDAAGPALARGTAVTQTGEEGLFFKIRTDSGSGYVPRLYASAFPPSQKVNFGTGVDKDTSVKARARASNYSQTVAARGISESQSLRTRSGFQDFDFDSIGWIEHIQVSQAEQTAFESGGVPQ
ncbi:MAG: hypothetical protein JNM27_05965 [Leptospirales bacterium]|nr:hypothetical protein [Leptospirales bacterium]